MIKVYLVVNGRIVVFFNGQYGLQNVVNRSKSVKYCPQRTMCFPLKSMSPSII